MEDLGGPRTAAAVLALVVLALPAGCSSSDGSPGRAEDDEPVKTRDFASYEELHQAAVDAGIPCSSYTPGKGLGVGPSDSAAVCVGEGDPDVIGDETITILELWGSVEYARAWFGYLLDSDAERDETGPRLLGTTWMVFSERSENLELMQQEAGGRLYSADGPLPAWYTQGSSDNEPPAEDDPSLNGLSPTTPKPEPEDQSGGPGEGCMDNCNVTVDKIVDDLAAVICAPALPGVKLADDITNRDPFSVDADVIRVCTGGGSADLSSLGIVHVFDDYDAMRQTALMDLQSCPTPGVSVFGGEPGGPGWIAVGIQSGRKVVSQLTSSGGTRLCG